jgi:hypothetical protein
MTLRSRLERLERGEALSDKPGTIRPTAEHSLAEARLRRAGMTATEVLRGLPSCLRQCGPAGRFWRKSLW